MKTISKSLNVANRIDETDQVFRTIGQIGDQLQVPVYVVGGFVRDLLLGRGVKDIDFVVEGDGPDFAKAVSRELGSTRLAIYRTFGTAMVQLDDAILEFVGARSESYRSESRNPNVRQADLQADLTRRDFTMNAMAVALNSDRYGDLIDPFHGQRDLKKHLIRTPLEPEQTFYDDPLRILRAIRFASQLNFDIDRPTREGLEREAHRLSIISQERITDELFSILATPKPSVGLEWMDHTNVLESVLPEMARLKGVDQIGSHRHKDVFKHTLKVVDNVALVSEDIRLRFVALYHDVAKPVTKAFQDGVGWTFHGHEEIGARMMNKIGKWLIISNNLLDFRKKMIRLHLRPIHLAEEGVTDSAIRRLLFQAGEDVDDLITLCRADITSQNPRRVAKHLANFHRLVERMQVVEEKDRIRQFQPPVRGDEIMSVCGIGPGPMVGHIKKHIEEAILNGEIPNEYQAAYSYLLRLKDDLLDQGSPPSPSKEI